MHPMLNMGIRAVRAAGDFIVRCMDQMQGISVTEKSRNDFVSEVDRRAEQIIIDNLRKAYPDHAILAEESGGSGTSDYQWIIDPLDGTTNFLHGYPQFAVSVALAQQRRPRPGDRVRSVTAGIIYCKQGRRRPSGTAGVSGLPG